MSYTYPNESAAYREARNDLLEKEIALRAQIEAVAEARRALPDGGALKSDYVFTRADTGDLIPFVNLFGDHSTLVLYSMMFGAEWDAPCPSCTSIVDAINTAGRTVGQRAGVAVTADASAEQLKTWGERRGWSNVNLISAHGTGYLEDYAGFETDVPGTVSAMNVFRRRGDTVVHFWGSELASHPMDNGHPRHADMFWPLWNVLDLTPDGRGDIMVPAQDFEHHYFSKHILGDG